MPAKFKKSEKVEWMWLGRPIPGVIEEIFFESVTKELKGKKITRHGTKEKPAYLVKSDVGNFALKLETELQKPLKKSKSSTPKMFS